MSWLRVVWLQPVARRAATVRGIATIALCVIGSVGVTGDPSIRSLRYHNLAPALEIANDSVKVVVSPAAGGRILEYKRLQDRSALWCDVRQLAAAEEPGGEVGGVRMSLVSGDDTIIPADAGAWSARILEDGRVRLQQPEQSDSTTQMWMDLHLDDRGTRMRVSWSVRNVSDHIVRCALREISSAPAGSRVVFPRPSASRFSGGLRLWRGGADGNGQLQTGEKVVVINHLGRDFAVGSDTDGGWVAIVQGGLTMLKTFPVVRQAAYPLGGCSLTVAADAGRVDVAVYSPLRSLLPGDAITLSEEWFLQRAALRSR